MSVNILDQNGNLKKIAHGFSESKFNTFRSDVISNIEMTDTASKDYAVGDFLIMANGQLAQVTSTIYQDMTINLSNVRLTTVEEMIAAKADRADIVDAVTDGDMRAVTSNAVHDALESKADKTAISSVETTNTAVSAHAVGSYFINASGQFVKVTSAIAIGDTISGSNTTVSSVEEAKASKSDLTSIITTGATNTTGATISKGTYFYLNGVLVKAKADIASGATFTSGTNYEAKTVGEVLQDYELVTEVLTPNVGNSTSNTKIQYALTDARPEINKTTLASISVGLAKGSVAFDDEGLYNWGFGGTYPDRIYIHFFPKRTQTNVSLSILVTYYRKART